MAERGRPSKLTAADQEHMQVVKSRYVYEDGKQEWLVFINQLCIVGLEQGRKDRDEEIISLYGDFL